MTFLEKLNAIERLHQLIRLQATGSPKTLANKFGISNRAIFNIINLIKNMGAPVEYCINKQSYYYTHQCEFIAGYIQENTKAKKKILNNL